MEKSCYFCQENSKYIDYKNAAVLRNFLSGQGKILPPRRTGVCHKHQQLLSQAIKRARIMAFIPFTAK